MIMYIAREDQRTVFVLREILPFIYLYSTPLFGQIAFLGNKLEKMLKGMKN